MSIERVRAFLREAGYEDRLIETAQSSATVQLAAQAVGVIPARIAKTLSFRVGEGCILIVAAGDARIDNGKFKSQFGVKAKMCTCEEALSATGHAIGGVCPFALPEGVAVYLDRSMRRFDTVYPAGGSANSAVRLTCDELAALSGAKGWIDVCKIVE